MLPALILFDNSKSLYLFPSRQFPPTEGSQSAVYLSSICVAHLSFLTGNHGPLEKFYCFQLQRHMRAYRLQTLGHRSALVQQARISVVICSPREQFNHCLTLGVGTALSERAYLRSPPFLSLIAHGFTEYEHFFLMRDGGYSYFNVTNNKVLLLWEQYTIT